MTKWIFQQEVGVVEECEILEKTVLMQEVGLDASDVASTSV